MAWLLLKDTVNSCIEYRILGLAAEAAFFTLLSVPPLLLSLVGLLGYVDAWTGTDTIASLQTNILAASSTVLSDEGVQEIARPILQDVVKGGRPDVISLGFGIALWSGSRAVNVFVDTITVMYGLDGERGIVKTRLLSFMLFVIGLIIGSVALPLMVAGPDAVVQVVPGSETAVQILYWPVVILLSVAFLTTLYHVSVPAKSSWAENVPGALVALAMWVLGSIVLRLYLISTVEGPTIYGSLAAPIAVLLWIGVSAFAVLVGAAVNAAIDRVWPSVATAAARRAHEDRTRDPETPAAHGRRPAHRWAGTAGAPAQEPGSGDEGRYEGEYDGGQEGEDRGSASRGRPAGGIREDEGPVDDDPFDDGTRGEGSGPDDGPASGAADMPAEFPERWSRFLPPDDVTGRIRAHSKGGGTGSGAGGAE